MEIIEIESKGYEQFFPSTYHVFNSAEFNLLNEYKCDKLLFLIFKDKKYRLGLIAGVRNEELHTPFSAPFGGYSFSKGHILLTQIENCVDALIKYCRGKGYKKIHYTMPPLFYNEPFNNKILNVLDRKKFQLSASDLNYAYDVREFSEDYESTIWYNARKNLKISFKQDLRFIKCETDESKLEAYEIVRENRSRKGYPIKLSYGEIEKTATIIPADFFLLKQEEHTCASAIVFHVTKDIVQVIYWGYLSKYSHYKPMNFLAYHIFKYYKEQGFKIVDLGPSTENGIPNYGLCQFKESIGCTITCKFSFTKSVEEERV